MDSFLELHQLSSCRDVLVSQGITLEDLSEMSMEDVRLSAIKPFHKRKLIMGARAHFDTSHTPLFQSPVFGTSLFDEPLFGDFAPAALSQPSAPPSSTSPSSSSSDVVADEWCARCGARNLRDFRFCGACGSPAVRTGVVSVNGLTTSPPIDLRPEDLFGETKKEAAAAAVASPSSSSSLSPSRPSPPPPDWKQVAMQKKKQEASPPARRAASPTLSSDVKPALDGVLVRLPPHTRSKADDDLLRRHVYFGDRSREFEALLQKPGVDWAGPFDTYNHATPLALACGRGHISVVKALLDKKVPVNSQDDVGSSPLCWAASHGHIEPALLLLQNGAFVNCVDVEGMTPLHYACIFRDCPRMVSLLLEHGADPNREESVSYRRPLDVALQFERREYARLIEAAGGKRSTRLLRNGDLAIARRKELKKKHQQEMQNEARKARAADASSVGVISPSSPPTKTALTKNGSAASSTSPIAVATASPGIVAAAPLENNVPARAAVVPRTPDEDDTLRGHCWFNNRHAEFKQFLARPDFDFSSPFKSYNNGTALILAASRGHMETVRALVSRGVDLDATNLDKCNAFNWAVTQKHFDVALFLVSHGCDVDLLDKHGMSSLHYACIARDFDLNLVMFLVNEAKCKINLLSSNGRTALDLAISRNRPTLISFLKSKGGKIAAKQPKKQLKKKTRAYSTIASRISKLSPFPGATVPTLVGGGPKPTPRLEWARRHTAAGVGRMTDLSMSQGKGAYVLTDNNEVLLDFATGIGTVILGHAHPDVVRAVQEQAAKISHAQVNISFHNKQLDLVERLIKIMPKGLDRIFFWNGGADAVEAAWKLARHATGKKNIIAMHGSYHGRTFATMGMTNSKTIYSAGFGPFVPGVYTAPFPYCLHCPASCGSDKCCNNPITQLEEVFKQSSAPSDTAAVILEPILGEGGYVPPPKGYLTKLREVCTKNNVLLIVDEIQTGFGRTGKYFAVQHEEVIPDILIFAKGIANGHVLSGIASTYDLMQKQPAGSMGGTYAGNVVSCAAACATLDVLERDKILQNVNARAPELHEGLLKLKKQFPDVIRDVRGKGLMIGVEFDASLNYTFAAEVSKLCLHQGMLLLTTSAFPTVRFIPPLNVTATEVQLALDIFAEAVRLASAKKSEFLLKK